MQKETGVFHENINFQSKRKASINKTRFYFEKFSIGIYYEKFIIEVMSPVQRRIIAMGKHLTLDDRSTIASKLNNQETFAAIAADLNRDCSTISREVRNHRLLFGKLKVA